MLNAAVLVSGDGAELQSLFDSVFFGEIEGFKLAAMISSSPTAYALSRAHAAGIPSYIVDESLFPNGASFNLALLNKLQDIDIDLVILAGFAPRLGEGPARVYSGRAISIRCALSPAFDDARELEVCDLTVARGAKWSGATICLLDDSGVAGEILLQKPVEVSPGDTGSSLRRRIIVDAVWELLPQAIKLYIDMRK